jgi:hypothetical protein
MKVQKKLLIIPQDNKVISNNIPAVCSKLDAEYSFEGVAA